jgi:hypothetical protein
LSDANLAHADLDGSNLSPQDARLPGVRWLDTTCPNRISSDEYTSGCFSKPLHNPLVVTVNGVKPNGKYVLGGFKVTCHTADALEPVTVPAKLKITNTGPNGIGKTTATCQGAVDATAAASFAKAGDVEVTLTGPGIGERTAKCGWKASSRVLRCVVPIPSGAKAGHNYHLTALENPGLPSWDLIPSVSGSVNPQPVKFK